MCTLFPPQGKCYKRRRFTTECCYPFGIAAVQRTAWRYTELTSPSVKLQGIQSMPVLRGKFFLPPCQFIPIRALQGTSPVYRKGRRKGRMKNFYHKPHKLVVRNLFLTFKFHKTGGDFSVAHYAGVRDRRY